MCGIPKSLSFPDGNINFNMEILFFGITHYVGYLILALMFQHAPKYLIDFIRVICYFVVPFVLSLLGTYILFTDKLNKRTSIILFVMYIIIIMVLNILLGTRTLYMIPDI